jgi:Bax protein
MMSLRQCFFLVFIFPCLGFAAVESNVSQMQKQFIRHLLPDIIEVNKVILAARDKIELLHHYWSMKAPLSASDKIWLADMAKEYGLNNLDFNDADSWNQLLRRVDIIPPSMALAQAITESAWGTSRFAIKGNNYYGLHCYKKGCGIPPLEKPDDDYFEVKAYPSAHASVVDYIYNLNTNVAYIKLRETRSSIRNRGEPLFGKSLIEGLTGYSILRSQYIDIIDTIIDEHNLKRYDDFENATMKSDPKML